MFVAAARDDADVAAERAPELGLAARRDHLELIDRVDAVRHPAQPRRIVVGREAVDDEVVREVALAANREADAGHRRRLGEELRAADVRRRDAGHEQRDVEEVAAVERQARHLGLRDGAGNLAARAPRAAAPCRLTVTLVATDSSASVIGQIERRADGQRQLTGRARRILPCARRSRTARRAGRETESARRDRSRCGWSRLVSI